MNINSGIANGSQINGNKNNVSIKINQQANEIEKLKNEIENLKKLLEAKDELICSLVNFRSFIL